MKKNKSKSLPFPMDIKRKSDNLNNPINQLSIVLFFLPLSEGNISKTHTIVNPFVRETSRGERWTGQDN